jgi:DNA modification methylase
MTVRVLVGNTNEVLRGLPAGIAQTCVTSPPYYGLRSYLPDGHPDKHLEIGLEETPDAYIARLVDVFREVRRVLRDDGTLWLNLGDSYAGGGGFCPTAPSNQNGGSLSARQDDGSGSKPKGIKPGGLVKAKDLLGIPWMAAFALRADGWFLRSAIVWAKPNPMPESVRDRPTSSYEMVFLLTKQGRYFYDAEAIAEDAIDPGVRISTAYGNAGTGKGSTTPYGANERETRNARNVWTIATQPFSGAHFATMPPHLAERCIKAGSKPGDTVLDPFGGAGTTGLVADRLGRSAILCELNPEYARLARERITADAPLFAGVA